MDLAAHPRLAPVGSQPIDLSSYERLLKLGR